MASGTADNRRRIWSVVLGAAIGVALGIVVSVTTDIPLAPEAGLLLGGLVGWFSAAALRR
jgi:hypothetical protein